MGPVIPKVRVGDILLGTKNIRNWLQTASLLGYINQLANDYSTPKKGSLYLPSKKDRFVVAVNAWETFAVWGLDRDLVILFCNPTKERLQGGRGYAVPAPMPRHLDLGDEVAMSPALFSQWFIRTQGKRPDLLKTWPDHAYYLWASLQMNGISNPEHPVSYMIPPGVDTSFITHLHNEHPKSQIRERVQESIQLGLVRSKQRRRKPVGGRAYGPSLRDIPRWRAEISGLTANPRVVKKLKEKVILEIPQAVYDLVVNS